MAYTWYILDAFLPAGATEGYDYVTAEELLKRITETSLGRCYIDEEGYLVYETQNVRPV